MSNSLRQRELNLLVSASAAAAEKAALAARRGSFYFSFFSFFGYFYPFALASHAGVLRRH